MGLRTIRRQLRETVLATKHHLLFQQAQEREPALATHHTVSATVAMLSDEREDTYPEREALLRALVREHQQHPSQLWSSLLLLAFLPMLLRLRGRLTSAALSSEELDQMVLEAFLDEAHALPLDRYHTRCAMHLRQQSQRRVFLQLRRQQRFHDQTELVEDPMELAAFRNHAPAPDDVIVGGSSALDDPEALLALLVAHLGDRIPRDRLELLAHTMPGGESVRAYAARLHPDLTDEALERAYQRLKRARLRTQQRVQSLLSPSESADALPCTEADDPTPRRHP